MNDDLPADVAFNLFMATVEYDDLTRWEKRAYAWHKKTDASNNPYSPDVEQQIAAYASTHRKKTAA